MSALLPAKKFPGATTALVIGDPTGLDTNEFAAYRHLLWWFDSASAAARDAFGGHPSVQAVPVDETPHEGFAGAIEAFLLRDRRHMPSIYVSRNLGGRHVDSYTRLLDEVYSQVEQHQRIRDTRQQVSFAWQKHALQNADAYSRQPIPSGWAGALRGLPAFVVGAGPSLDVSAPVLARYADRAVILAADSALRSLGRRGVAADFCVSIDAAKVPDRCLPPGTPPPGRVVIAIVSPPEWKKVLSPERIGFVSARQIPEDWLISLGVARPAVAASESCGSTALELALFLGCDPIYLFGLDLAVDAANPAQRHHRDADLELYKKSNYDPSAALPHVPGNFTPTVPCFAFGDWRALDARLAALNTARVFNVNDRGARLRGATLLDPGKFALDAAAGAKLDPLAALAPPSADSPEARSAVGHARETVRRAARAVPLLRAALAEGGPPALAAKFRPIITDPEIGRLFGAYSFKLMPHLFPPTDGDTAFWQGLLDEFAALTAVPEILNPTDTVGPGQSGRPSPVRSSPAARQRREGAFVG